MLLLKSVCVIILLTLGGCHTAYQKLHVHNLPNYDKNATHRIIFLDFTITRSGVGKPEKLNLVNSIVGNGDMKNLRSSLHSPYQLKIVRQYSDHRPPETDSLEHPLMRLIEISDTDGSFTRVPTSELTGNFSIRFPYIDALQKVDIYSITADKGTVRIHTLYLKP